MIEADKNVEGLHRSCVAMGIKIIKKKTNCIVFGGKGEQLNMRLESEEI